MLSHGMGIPPRQPRGARSGSGNGGINLAGSDPITLVEDATSEQLQGEPAFDVNLALVDLLNINPRDSPLVLEVLKRKIMTKKHDVGLLAVILLDSLVKNCAQFHPYIGNRDFMESILVKSLPRSIRKPHEGPSLNSILNEPSDIKSPVAIQRWEATLKCIAAWSEAFDSSNYPIFREVHRMLERRGVRFPTIEKDENVKIFLPDKPNNGPSSSSSPPAAAQPSAPSAQRSSAPAPSTSGGLSANAINDIKTGSESAQLLKEMVENADPNQPIAKDELIQQLYASCRSSSEILSQRLTRYANHEGSVDEATMAQVILAHEHVQEAIKLYTDALNGIRPPKKAAPSAGGASRGQRSVLQESKEDDESYGSPQPRRAMPADYATGKSSVPQTSSQKPAKVRRPSDLPADLTQFDMLGLSESPPAVQQQQVSPQPVSKPHHVDPFSTPAPTVNHNQPSHLSVVTSTPVAASPASSSGKKSSSTTGLIAPPPSSTRHRGHKDNSKRQSGEAGVLGLVPSPANKPQATPVTPQSNVSTTTSPPSNLFDLDSFMNPPTTTPASAITPNRPTNPSFAYNTPQMNIFNAFNSGATVPATTPGGSNPFDAFDSERDANPFDAFDAIATRTTPSKK